VKNKNETLSPETLHLQSALRPDLTPVFHNRDHLRLMEDLTKLDQDLRSSGLEALAMSLALEGMDDAPFAQQNKRCEFAIYSLRAELLRHMLGTPSFAAYSVTLSTSDLFSDFCRCRQIDGIRWTSKSTLHRASTFFDEAQLRKLNNLLVRTLGGAHGARPLGLARPEDLSVCLIDSTCLKADIHFPVDWVLLRDVSITLLKAVILIRKEGLLHRMPDEPEQFIREMNKLSIEMTHARRRQGAPRERKKILRKMKRLLKRIGEHARRHRDLLDAKFGQTQLSQAQAARITARIDEKLELLPKVIEQAHERIIGERQVKNKEKILSAHEPDIDVIVRGKAGAQVEFGNELFLAVSPGGLIFDYKLYGRAAPGEGLKMQQSIERLEELNLPDALEYVVADRGFDSKGSEDFLTGHGIESMICPKDPQRLQERLKEEKFRKFQTRRGGTEARIGIFKNHTRSRVWRAKGLAHRQLAVGWSVLAHNLEWVARRVREQRAKAPLAESA
jgi:hypothetical protein